MFLKFSAAWHFTPPENGLFLNKAFPPAAATEFLEVITKICTQGNRQDVLELFKARFCWSVGATHYWSSNEGWAEIDLESYMRKAADNAPLFIDAFIDACETLRERQPEWFVPDAAFANSILAKHNIGYEIRPPDLVLRELTSPPIPAPERPPTLTEQAVEVFQKSLNRSEQLLMEGRCREAIQEILWLLETVSTAFRGMDTASGKVEGKYFNQIVRDLRTKHPGTTLDRVLEWTSATHGYLSSPSGGGIRHGLDLNQGVALSSNEARLFCNLIRTYLFFLLGEHERLKDRER